MCTAAGYPLTDRAVAWFVLSLQQCRELLGSDLRLDDTQLEALRNQLYDLAKVCVASLIACPQLTEHLDGMGEDELADVHERAAILEFDGKLPRAAAERLAMAQLRAAKPPH